MKKLIILFLLSVNCYASSWECDSSSIFSEKESTGLCRIKVPNGWIVKYTGYRETSITFNPDPEYKWKL